MDIGGTVGHYRILELIGQGGMGEVYLAEDTTLDRKVALKVLPAEVAADDDRRGRFEREAKAVAALNHPNIVTIHSVEADGDTHFITMEFIAGETLSQQIPTGGFELERLFAVAVPLADALATAHEQGITHRDLKPDNVMFDGRGQVRLLDFGLAKLSVEEALGGDAEAKTQAVQTEEGKILGTVYYMSPEQAEGKPVDSRSDVFSLGVMLYEMATGRRPFEGDTRVSTISSIMKDDPQPITEMRHNAPRHLARIINRCLHKDPERRFESAKGLRNELEELWSEVRSGELQSTVSDPRAVASPPSAAPPPTAPPSASMPSDPSQPPAPSAAPAGPVTGSDPGVSASSMPSADPQALSQSIPPLDPRKKFEHRLVAGFMIFIGIAAIAVLGPRVIEEWSGAFAGSGGSASVDSSAGGATAATTAAAERPTLAVLPLVNTSGDDENDAFTNGIHDDLITQISRIGALRVISRTSVLEYADTTKNLRQIGGELGAATILEGSVQRSGDNVRINVRLTDTATDEQLWADSYTRDTARGIFEIQSEIATEVAAALQATLSATERAGLANVPTENLAAYDHYVTGQENMRTSFNEVAYRTAEEAYEQAIALDPDFADAYAALSITHSSTYWAAFDYSSERVQRAYDAARRALELDPDSAEAHLAMGYYYYYGFRDYDRALEELALAAQLRPGDADILQTRGFVYRRQGRWAEGLAALEQAAVLAPRDSGLLDALSSTYSALRRNEDALRVAERAVAVAPNNPNGLMQRATAAMALGDARPMRELAQRRDLDEVVLFAQVNVALTDGDFAAVVEALRGWPEDVVENQVNYDPKDASIAWALWMNGDAEEARGYAASAADWYRERLATDPEDSRLHSGLSTVLAILGEGDAAVEAADRAAALLPLSADAFDAPDFIVNKALTQAILGEDATALELLEEYFSHPGGRTDLWWLEISPEWAGVRELPGWPALAAKARQPVVLR